MNALDIEIDLPYKYIIEGLIEYSPQDNKLTHCQSGKTISLLSSASECFLLLIKNHGKLVTKSMLVNTGWEQYGLHVSDNTFYQNTLTLRKAFKTFGISREVVKTIPRKGLLIPDYINIEILDDISGPHAATVSETVSESAEQSSVVTDNTLTALQLNSVDAQVTPISTHAQQICPAYKNSAQQDTILETIQPHESFTQSLKSYPDGSCDLLSDSKIDETVDRPTSVNSTLCRLSGWLICLVLLAVTITLGVAFSAWKFYPNNHMDVYVKMPNIAGCQIYSNKAAISANLLRNKMQSANIRCNNGDVLYATSQSFIQRFSIIHCQHTFTSWLPGTCTSYYFLEK